jgi:hypothetical protein
MVTDAKLLSNDCRNAPGCPDLADEAERLGALGEQSRELCQLLGGQPWRRAGWRPAV